MMKERAEKVDKLEAEILRYKDKMNDIEFFKTRVEELREDNRYKDCIYKNTRWEIMKYVFSLPLQ